MLRDNGLVPWAVLLSMGAIRSVNHQPYKATAPLLATAAPIPPAAIVWWKLPVSMRRWATQKAAPFFLPVDRSKSRKRWICKDPRPMGQNNNG